MMETENVCARRRKSSSHVWLCVQLNVRRFILFPPRRDIRRSDLSSIKDEEKIY